MRSRTGAEGPGGFMRSASATCMHVIMSQSDGRKKLGMLGHYSIKEVKDPYAMKPTM